MVGPAPEIPITTKSNIEGNMKQMLLPIVERVEHVEKVQKLKIVKNSQPIDTIVCDMHELTSVITSPSMKAYKHQLRLSHPGGSSNY